MRKTQALTKLAFFLNDRAARALCVLFPLFAFANYFQELLACSVSNFFVCFSKSHDVSNVHDDSMIPGETY